MKQNHVIHIVVGTMSGVVLIGVLAVAIIAIFNMDPRPEALSALKEFVLFSLGAIGAILARTNHVPESKDVHVTNPPSDPVQVSDTK